jgi:putative ABC transport system permease protein
MVTLLQQAFNESDFDISFSVTARSVLVAYAIGVLLTFAVVTLSARQVSRMNIVTAIRDLPEPPPRRGERRHLLRGAAGLVLGALLIASGVSAENGTILGLGVSLAILGAVPVARAAGVGDRAARTTAGLALVLWFVLPMQRWLFGDLNVDFSIFILSGLMVVIGATWTMMYNADILLGFLARTLGRSRAVAPVLKMSMAYPLRGRFRTGVTLAMFTLVVFTLVVGATTSGSFRNGFDDSKAFGGGFDVRADVAAANPVPDMRRAAARAPGIRPQDLRVVSEQSFLPVKARQADRSGKAEDYVVRGMDRAFLSHTTYALAAKAEGFDSSAQVWRAVRDRPGLAVVDALTVPHRANFNFGPPQDFRLKGFYLEDGDFTPVPVTVRDPQTGRRTRLTVVGVLSETAPLALAGLLTSQRTAVAAFGDRVVPTSYLFALAPGTDPRATAKRLESAFVANGMEADALDEILADGVAANLTFDRLIEGFMGLGLIVGVAALGVVSARSVVERRQQIGVLRSIGFRRGMVQLSLLLESTFIAATSIVVGSILGLAIAYSVIHDAQQQPSWGNLSFDVPWVNLAVIFLVVFLVALATTYLPARRAARIYPAVALRSL